MANQPHQKLKTLQILQMLFEQADSTHGLTTQEIIDNLAAQGIPAERKAIYRDIEILKQFGLAIEHPNDRWRLTERPLQLEELIMLVDAVQSAPFLTEEHLSSPLLLAFMPQRRFLLSLSLTKKP